MVTKELEQELVDQLVAKLSSELKTPLDKRDVDLCEKLGKVIDEKIKAAREEDERARAKFIIPGVGKEETRKFSFHAIVRAKVTGDYSQAGYELEMIREASKTSEKAMSAGTDSAGGFLVPPQVLENELIPLLRDELIAVKLGARLWTGLVGSPQEISKVTSGSTGYWVGEAPPAGVPLSTPAVGMLKLTEHTPAARCIVSNKLLRQSSGVAEQLIRDDIVLTLKELIDTAFFSGTGVDNQPKGILETTGISTVTSFGVASAGTSYNKLLDMIYTLAVSKALRGKLAWAAHPTVIGKFQQMKDLGTNTDDAQPKARRLFDAAPISDKLIGYPFQMATYLPTNDILFANFDDSGIATWAEMIMDVSKYTSNMMETLQTMVLASWGCDIGIRRVASFCHTTGMTGAP